MYAGKRRGIAVRVSRSSLGLRTGRGVRFCGGALLAGRIEACTFVSPRAGELLVWMQVMVRVVLTSLAGNIEVGDMLKMIVSFAGRANRFIFDLVKTKRDNRSDSVRGSFI